MRLELPLDAKLIQHWPYRKARVLNHIIVIDALSSGDEGTKAMRAFHASCAVIAGVRPDNHECYSFESQGNQFHYWFSDWKLYVGTKIWPKDW